MVNDIGIKWHVEEANNEALERMRISRPILIDIVCARDVLPQMKKNSIFHAGPPIDWERKCGPLRGAIVGTISLRGWQRLGMML